MRGMRERDQQGDALYSGSGSGLDFLRKGLERRNQQGVGGRGGSGVSGDHVASEMLVPTSPLPSLVAPGVEFW